MTLAIVIALEQLHIGSLPLLVAFAIVFAGIVFALAIAFGLGLATWRVSGLRQRCAILLPKRRFFVISKSTRTLVFSDLDGALLDPQSYSWTAASRGLGVLRRSAYSR